MSDEITTTETMEDFTKELDESFRKINEGDIVKGTVIGVSDTEVTIDLGTYTDGIIKSDEYSNNPNFSIKTDVVIGEEVSALVVKTDDGSGHLLLSKKAATDLIAWDKLQSMMDNKETIHVTVDGIESAGVIAYVEGIRGFIPASKLSLGYVEDLNEYLKKELDVRIITVDKKKNRLVMSARDILKEKAEEERKNKISNIEIGLVTEGVVKNIQPYGAFVNLGDGLSGMVHISQICNKRLKHPKEVLSEGDKVKVKIIAIKDGKLSLSMKALETADTEEISEEDFVLPEAESLTTSMASLFKDIKLDS